MSGRNTPIKCLFGLYCLMMLWLLLLRRIDIAPGDVGVNLQPLDTVKRYLWVLRYSSSRPQLRYACANLLGNVALLLPLGLFLPMLFQKMRCFGLFFLCIAFGILAVELCQLYTGLGICDVDDWLLNVIGTVLGWLLWKLWTIYSRKKTE